MARPSAKDAVATYNQAKAMRSQNENEYRMAAAYCLPLEYSAWQTDGPAMYRNSPAAARRVQYDSTGARSLPKYVSILERIATPVGQKWHGLMPSNANLRKVHRVRQYFDELQNLLFKFRYDPKAWFRTASSEVYSSMGVYGNGPVFIGERRRNAVNRLPGFKYIACPFRDVFFLIDDEGEIVAVFRRFWLNYRQFVGKFGADAPVPKCFEAESKKTNPNEQQYEEFVHYVHIRTDYDEKALDARRHPICGSYLCVKDAEYVGDETGFRSMPYKIPRTMTVAGNAYGYSPAILAMPALGAASAVKKTYLKQGQKAVDPVLLVYDDGVLNGEVDLRPGASNPGGLDKMGNQLVKPLQTGNFNVAENILADERSDIEDSFFVTLFQILNDTPEMTATEVMERVAEKASLLSPTMGRLQSEFLGPTIEREIDLLAEMGLLPEMPPELKEAQGEYEVVYTSPLAKGLYAEEVSGFMRSFEMAVGAANAMQDASPLDHYNLDVALPEISDYMAVPARWMNDDKTVKSNREGRAAKTQEAQLLQNAPALASAAATAAKITGGKPA